MREYESAIGAAGKVAPPIVATGMTVFGYPIADWLVVITIIYTIVQLAIVLRGAVRRKRRAETACAQCEHGDV